MKSLQRPQAPVPPFWLLRQRPMALPNTRAGPGLLRVDGSSTARKIVCEAATNTYHVNSPATAEGRATHRKTRRRRGRPGPCRHAVYRQHGCLHHRIPTGASAASRHLDTSDSESCQGSAWGAVLKRAHWSFLNYENIPFAITHEFFI